MRFSLLFALLVAVSVSAAPDPIPLWPAERQAAGKAPEGDITKPGEGLVAGRSVIRMGNVVNPTLTIYPAPASNRSDTAILVLPGGAYQILALDLEGTEVCEWLNSLGITAGLLKYRVPRPTGGEEKHAFALEDAQRAMRLMRERAATGALKANRIGVLGFSAGGHLAASLAASRTNSYKAVDAADTLRTLPDFDVLIYPAYLTVKEEGDRVAGEVQVTTNTPPTFIAISQDDPVRVENALHYALSLRQNRVPFGLHVYPRGGHGYGLRKTDALVTTWPARLEEWLREQGYLPKTQP